MRICLSGDDMEIPADAWETLPGFETQKHSSSPTSGSGAGWATVPPREGILNNFGGHLVQDSTAEGESPRRCTDVQGSVVRRGSSGSVRIQTAGPAPLMAAIGGGGGTRSRAKRGHCVPDSASNVEASLSTDDFFASVEREAAQRNL